MGRMAPVGTRHRERRITMLALLLLLGAGPAVAEPTTSSRGDAAPATLVLTNRSDRTIDQLYVAAPNAEQWGDDRLQGGSVPPGEHVSVVISRDAGCSVDVQVVYRDATVEERHGVAICGTANVAFDGSGAALPTAEGDIGAHDLALVNHAGRPIEQLFIAGANADQWGENLLAKGAVAVGDDQRVSFQGSCVADLRIVYNNRSAEERRDVDLCASGLLVISPGWTTADPRPDATIAARSGAQPVLVQTLTVTNHATAAVTELRLVADGAAADNAVAHDLLGGQRLSQGGHVILPFVRGKSCRFTARITYAGDRPTRELAGLDLCRSSAIDLPAR